MLFVAGISRLLARPKGFPIALWKPSAPYWVVNIKGSLLFPAGSLSFTCYSGLLLAGQLLVGSQTVLGVLL
ncbi:MAG: hypothetical protein IJA83_01670, partial [Clostridia bacterium]|nr:hypothetical protein [Clostridia bacterium]